MANREKRTGDAREEKPAGAGAGRGGIARLSAYTTLQELAADARWRGLIDGLSAECALFGYFTLSGLPPDDAARLALALPEDSDPGVVKAIAAGLQQGAAPMLRRAMVAHGITDHWITGIIKEIGDDPGQDPMARLKAVELGAKMFRRTDPTPGADREKVGINISVTQVERHEYLRGQISDAIQSQGVSGVVIALEASAGAATQEEEDDDHRDEDRDTRGRGNILTLR